MIGLAGVLLAGAGAPILVRIHNVRDDRGHVEVALCPRDRFLASACPWHARAAASAGTVTLTIPNVPPGDYAAQAFHDENDNGRVDRGFFGIPREGVGFSRDARIVLGPPRWRDAEFAHGADAQTIAFSLRYFMGKSGPTDARQ